MDNNYTKDHNLFSKQYSLKTLFTLTLPLYLMALMLLFFPTLTIANYSIQNVMSLAHSKNVENGRIFSNDTLTHPPTGNNTSDNNVVNTAFSAGITNSAGCGLSRALLNKVYPQDINGLNKQYIALNVYSRRLGYDKKAPRDANPLTHHGVGDGGPLQGYPFYLMTTQLTSEPYARSYPYMIHFRPIPALYPAYSGLWNNGRSCGRYLSVTILPSQCADSLVEGKSKVCTKGQQTGAATTINAYVRDSCEDPNGWCRDYSAHIDINTDLPGVQGMNHYLKWHFISNPYYTNPNSPLKYHDIWFGWVDQYNPLKPTDGTRPNYDYALLNLINLKNGVSNVQYNINTQQNPLWINGHINASGNDVIWKSDGSGADTAMQWQLRPEDAIQGNSIPNPTYHIRLFDINGYPIHNGSQYQFHVRNINHLGTGHTGYGETTESAANKNDSNTDLFYGGIPTTIMQGTHVVKTNPNASLGTGDQQGPALTRYDRPTGTQSIVVEFPSQLQAALNYIKNTPIPNDLHIVLINQNGYSYDGSCTVISCIFDHIPAPSTSVKYHMYANLSLSDSNDVDLRKIRHIKINSHILVPKSSPVAPGTKIKSIKITGTTTLTLTDKDNKPQTIKIQPSGNLDLSTHSFKISSNNVKVIMSSDGVIATDTTTTPLTQTISYDNGKTLIKHCYMNAIVVEGKSSTPHTLTQRVTSIPTNLEQESLQLNYMCSTPITYTLEKTDYDLNTTFTGIAHVTLALNQSAAPVTRLKTLFQNGLWPAITILSQPNLSKSTYYNASALLKWNSSPTSVSNPVSGYEISNSSSVLDTIPFTGSKPVFYSTHNLTSFSQKLVIQPYHSDKSGKHTHVGSPAETTALKLPSDNQNVIPRLFFTLVPTSANNLIAYPQGCWLHAYFNATNYSTTTDCYIYYTEHHETIFNTTSPRAEFSLTAPQYMGASKSSDYKLASTPLTNITLTPYSGSDQMATPSPVSLDYQLISTQHHRSLMVLIDPQSDPACLQSHATVTITGEPKLQQPLTLSPADTFSSILLNWEVPTKLTATSSDPHCQAAFFSSNSGQTISTSTITPGINPITIIKLLAIPQQPTTNHT